MKGILPRFITTAAAGFALGITFVVNAAGASDSERSASQALGELLSQPRYFQATFLQTVHDAEGELVDQSNGAMMLSRPDKLRWEVDAPFEQVIVVNADDYYQYDSDIDQLIIQPLDNQLSAIPKLLLSGDASAIQSQFKVEELKAITASRNAAANDSSGSGSESIRVFTLKPLAIEGAQQDSLFNTLTLEFSGAQLDAIAILDDLEQVSRFQFSDHTLDTPIEDTRFVLVPPDGTDIIYR